VATKRTLEGNANLAYEQTNTFWYHSDHLGSAQLVSTKDGHEYERVEYTPYGELWIEQRSEHMDQDGKTPFRFTGKELDAETGFYYYGARYLNPKTSMWISADPAVSDYIPKAPVDDEAKKHNENLPGMGGVFNYVNMHVYHYAGNNPVKYVDPDGREIESTNVENNNFFLELITKIAGAGFFFDENNKLKCDESVDPGKGYSKTARNALVAGINDTEKTAYLKASTEFDHEGRGELGMARWIEGNKSAMVAFVIGPIKLPNSASGFLLDTYNATTSNAQAIGLAHELLGHVFPSLGITKGTDAMSIERTVRGELGWGTKLGTGRVSEGSLVPPAYAVNLDTVRRMK
jgi:RHS repeat-associated protein